MTDREKMERLYELAEQDSIYQTWKQVYEENEEAFRAYADKRSKPVRSILYSYAVAGRLMMQRLSNIACDRMEFLEGKEKGAE